MPIIYQGETKENLYTLAIDEAPVPLLLLDSDGRILKCNLEFEKFSGLSSEIVESKFFDAVLTHDSEFSANKAASDLQQIRQFECPLTGHYLLKNGNEKAKSVTVKSTTIARQDKCLFVVSITAILAEPKPKQSVKPELQTPAESFKLLVSGVKDYAIFMLTPDGIVASWNEGAQRIKGYTAEEIVGSHFSRFYTQDDVDKNKASEELATAIREGRYEEEGWRIRKDGSRFMAHVIITPIIDDNDTLKGFAKVTRDITEKRELVADIRDLQTLKADLDKNLAELKRSNEDLQQFAYVCSHDLQEPLRVISNYSQLLSKRYKNKVLDDTATEFIDITIDAAKRMQGLINDLLIYSRVNSAQREFGAVNCNEVIKRVVANLKVNIEETAATIKMDDFPLLHADATQLQQLFQNLLSNAIKFRAEEPPKIDITCSQEEDCYVFTIKDNGIGFDTKYSDRIFVMFQRLHIREAYPGSGIGLAVCKKIAERHGGRIWVESQPGVGSSFHFSIPCKAQDGNKK